MKKIIHLLLIIVIGLNIFAQGLNNDQYKFDQKDTENILSIFMDIETYKFNIDAQKNDYLDIIFEEFEDGKPKSSARSISELAKK